MVKLISTCIALFFSISSLTAQINFTAQFGLSGYEGDLHCFEDDGINLFDELGLSGGLGIRIPVSNQIGIRVEANFFSINGMDRNFDNEGHKNRGWLFKNNFVEMTSLVDYELFGAKNHTEYGKFKSFFTPVIFAGVGFNLNNPQIHWNDRTNKFIKADEIKNSKPIVAVPVGIGFKLYINEYMAISSEFGLRLPVSDYYDGISQAANPDQNDGYAFGGVKFFFTFGVY